MAERAELSRRQERMLEVIRDYTAEHGYPPTIREIGDAVGISSTSVVSYNLNILQRKGHLARNRVVSRGLRLLGKMDKAPGARRQRGSPPDGSVSIPLLGVIAAGEPIPIPDSDFSQIDSESISVTADIISTTDDVYALQVRGDSMVDALINNGDIVLMRHQQNAENGDMIAAWLRDEKATTLKRFYWDGGTSLVRLQPANPGMEPIFVHPGNLQIQGKVISVIRRLD